MRVNCSAVFQSFRSSLQGLLEAKRDNWHEASIGQETKAWPRPRDAPYALSAATLLACQIGPDQDTPSHPRIKPLSIVICPEYDDAEPSGQCRDPEVYNGTGLNLSATCTRIL